MRKKASKTTKSEKTRSPETNILSRAKPVAEVEDDVTAILYGRSGSGKTTTAGSFPKKVLILDFKEQGTDSVRDVEGIDVLHVQEWVEVEDIFWGLEAGGHEYKSVVLDTVSGMQDLAIIEAKARNGKDPDSPTTQQMWGEVSGLMKEWIYNYRDLPMNIVFLAHERIKEPETEDVDDVGQLDPEVSPNVIPSVAKTLCAAVKVIGHTYIRQTVKKRKGKPGELIKKTEYALRIGPHPFYITKIRAPQSHKVPDDIVNANYDKIKLVMAGKPVTAPKKTTAPKEE